MNKTVLKEVKRAYNESTRNLDFRATEPVNKHDAVKIMCRALECDADCEGYNDFRPELLERLPDDAQVTLAREGSVCVYFTTEENLPIGFQDLMVADEFDPTDNPGKYRLWWD